VATRYLCLLRLHDWTDWRAHAPPCITGPYVTHYVRKCKRCERRQNDFKEAPETDCGGCPNDPAEYFHCLRWTAGDPACRPKEK
jgi:hypothetical protein